MENLILIIITLIFIVILFILRRIEKHLTLHAKSLWFILEHLRTQLKKPKKNGKI